MSFSALWAWKRSSSAAMKYTYAYKTSDGTRHVEAMEAESREAVFAALREKGIKAIKVVAADGSKANGEVRGYRLSLKGLSELANVVIAMIAIISLWLTASSLRDTSEVNKKTVAYYEAQLAPHFRVRHDFPNSVTNGCCQDIVHGVRVCNTGFPVSSVGLVNVRTILFFRVYDKRLSGRFNFAPQPFACPTFYGEMHFPYLSDGLMFYAEAGSIQYEIASALCSYRKKHPDRVCEVEYHDFVEILYEDNAGVVTNVWLDNGSRVCKEIYQDLESASRAFTDSLPPIKGDYWEVVFDACFNANKKRTKK